MKLTFRGVCHVLKSQSEQLAQLEPLRNNISQALNLKANLQDVKVTVGEVVSNIESRASFSQVKNMLDDRVTKAEMTYLLKDKVNFEELNAYLKQNGGGSQVRQNSNSQKHGDLEHDIYTLRQKLDETLRIVQMIEPPMSLVDLEERFAEKANKQSVA